MKMYLLLSSTFIQMYMTATVQIQLNPQKNTRPTPQSKKLKQTLCQNLFSVCSSIFSHVSAYKLAVSSPMASSHGCLLSEPHATPYSCKATASPPKCSPSENTCPVKQSPFHLLKSLFQFGLSKLLFMAVCPNISDLTCFIPGPTAHLNNQNGLIF